MKFRGSTNKKSVSYAILSNTIVLILISMFLLIFFHINIITDVVKEKMNVVVELNDQNESQQRDALIKTIQSNESIVEGSVKFIPKAEANKIMKGLVTNDVLGGVNPFKDVIVYNLKAPAYLESNLEKIASEIKKSSIVSGVFYENVAIDEVKSTLKNISLGILSVSLIFAVLSIIIMYNTINLSLYADRFEIKTMEIIGARDGFIRQPYLKLAGEVAIKSFLIAAIISLLLLFGARYYFEGVNDVLRWFYVLITFGIVFAFSMIINIGATVSIVNKYLYTDMVDLYQQ
jgi:cell division transport system permease protein